MWNLPDFTWNPLDFTKSTGFHEIRQILKTNLIARNGNAYVKWNCPSDLCVRGDLHGYVHFYVRTPQHSCTDTNSVSKNQKYWRKIAWTTTDSTTVPRTLHLGKFLMFFFFLIFAVTSHHSVEPLVLSVPDFSWLMGFKAKVHPDSLCLLVYCLEHKRKEWMN